MALLKKLTPEISRSVVSGVIQIPDEPNGFSHWQPFWRYTTPLVDWTKNCKVTRWHGEFFAWKNFEHELHMYIYMFIVITWIYILLYVYCNSIYNYCFPQKLARNLKMLAPQRNLLRRLHFPVPCKFFGVYSWSFIHMDAISFGHMMSSLCVVFLDDHMRPLNPVSSKIRHHELCL